MKIALQFIFSFFLVAQLNAQLGTAPDFTVVDLDGNEHNLYNILDEGKIVILNASATWCPPCWSNHEAHILEDVYQIYGPTGMNVLEILYYEGDPSTTLENLMGIGPSNVTLGDWLTGTTYPFINESTITLQSEIYYPFGYPTVNVIRPSDREIVADPWNQNATFIGNLLEEIIDSEGLGESTSIEEELGLALQIVPNPTTDQLIISTSLDVDYINVMNEVGQQIAKIDGKNTTIDVSTYKAGNYLLQFYTKDNLRGIKKFTKI